MNSEKEECENEDPLLIEKEEEQQISTTKDRPNEDNNNSIVINSKPSEEIFEEDQERKKFNQLIDNSVQISPDEVKPVFFYNTLFNPQFDVYNPIFGLKKEKEHENNKDDEDEDENQPPKKMNASIEEVEMVKLFTSYQNTTHTQNMNDFPFETNPTLSKILPFFPLKKQEQILPNTLNQNELEKSNKQMLNANIKAVQDMYVEMINMVNKIFFIIFMLDILPAYIASIAINGDKTFGVLYMQLTEVQIIQFIFSIITYICIIILIKMKRNVLQEKFLANVNNEFMFGVLYSNLPNSTTLYDIIKCSRKTLGPNYGIIDIVMVNNYHELNEIKKYVDKKEILHWDHGLYNVVRDASMTEDKMKHLAENQKEQIKEEMKVIKLGSRFTGAAIVIYQTQEMVETMIKTSKFISPFIFYNFNKSCIINGKLVYMDNISEPYDILWKNLGISSLSRLLRVLLAYVFLILILIWIYLPIIGINPVSQKPIYNVNGYVVAYVFPFVALIINMILDIILMFLNKVFRFNSFSSELLQLSAFTFPFIQGAFIMNASKMMEFRGIIDYWDIHYIVGCFAALMIITPLKRIWTKNFLKFIFRNIKMNMKKSENLPFTRYEYNKFLKRPYFDWSSPFYSFMNVLAFVFVAKFISFYCCFLAIIVILFVWKIDAFFFKNLKIKAPSIMIIKAFFQIMDHAIYMLAYANGILPLVLNGSTIFALIWLFFTSGWLYLENLVNIDLKCFDFKLTKSNCNLLQNSKLQFIPDRYRKYVINIDRTCSV